MARPQFNIAGVSGACCSTPQGQSFCIDVPGDQQCNGEGAAFYPGELCADRPCEKGPCCYQDGRPCANLFPSACFLGGGVLGDVGARCASDTCEALHPCCLPDQGCVIATTEECESPDRLAGVSYPGNQSCEEVLEAGLCRRIIYGACCFPNGRCAQNVIETACERDGGTFFPNQSCLDVDCPSPPLPSGCISASSFRKLPERGVQWSLDLCHPIFMEPSVYTEDKFARMRSLNRVRAVEAEARFFGEPCGYHWGDYALNDEGFLEGYFCSEPVHGNQSHRQQSRTRTFIQLPEADPEGFVEQGFTAELGFYHSPYWTEARYDSHRPVCGQAR